MEHVSFITLGLILLYVAALFCVYRTLLSYRTPQGAIAWIIALLGLPYLAVPLFAMFGRNRFGGYVQARRLVEQSLAPLLGLFEQKINQVASSEHQHALDELHVLCNLGGQPFTNGNHCELLRNGEATFKALFAAMEQAREYILLEFYIVRSDKIGQRIKSVLERKLAEGVKVCFLYDDIGSFGLSRVYLKALSKAGASVASFGDGNVRRRRFQINFRNHRKLLICDGTIGFVGGINLADEYLGSTAHQAPWRDTHCQITGPAVLGLQLAWIEDWSWATGTIPQLNWQVPESLPGDQEVLILPTGPADTHETCTLFFLNCINNARMRVWIASPYFVPDIQIVNALQLAALRGVDVKILIPQKSDSLLVQLAAYTYLEQASRAGVGIYRYQPGFMHQKVVLVDHRYAAVGTANLDNRSMRLNFEITALNTAPEFVAEVKDMLEQDLKLCRKMSEVDYSDRSLLFRISCRAIRLLAPVL